MHKRFAITSFKFRPTRPKITNEKILKDHYNDYAYGYLTRPLPIDKVYPWYILSIHQTYEHYCDKYKNRC